MLANILSALLVATAGLGETSERIDLADAVFGNRQGTVGETDLATAGEALLQTLDDQSLSGTAEWDAASRAVDAVLHA